MLFAYIGTLAWQLIWLGLLPPPAGPANIWLAGFACLPLLLPLHGIMHRKHRSMIYGGIVLLLYFTVAVTEIWTTPAHRWPAGIQMMLPIIYIFAFRMRIKSA